MQVEALMQIAECVSECCTLYKVLVLLKRCTTYDIVVNKYLNISCLDYFFFLLYSCIADALSLNVLLFRITPLFCSEDKIYWSDSVQALLCKLFFFFKWALLYPEY